MNKSIENILEFWFGTFPNAWLSDPAKTDMWFRHGSDYDQEIFIKFGALYHKACEGELDHWLEMPRGRLALIILLDQFSRHIHRGTAESFAQDERVQEICLDGISAGDDQQLHPVERSFFYLPLEHAENLDRQNLSLEAYTRLAEDVPAEYRQMFESALEYAKKHHFVINLFGRFPELNKILGRDSNEDEKEFMKVKEYSFL